MNSHRTPDPEGNHHGEHWLVIAHEATNSGAPRMLLRVLQGVREARGADWRCEILLRGGGPLAAQFAEFGPVHLLPHRWARGRSLGAGFYRKFIDRPWGQPRRAARWMEASASRRFDLVYNNTATNGFLVPLARSLGCPVVTHVHELGESMRRFNTPAALADSLKHTDHFFAVSEAVATDLVQLGAPAERITVVPNFLPQMPAVVAGGAHAELCRQLGLPEGAGVVTGCGHIDAVKGTELFVAVAAAVVARAPQRPVVFPWLGGITDARFARDVRALVRRRQLQDVVRFVGPVDDPLPWFAASDAVAVTSRYESFSLVAMEAASVGCPVVGFAGARGISSVIGDTPELLAPGHDVEAMAALLHRLLEDRAQATRLGAALRARVAERFVARPCIEKIVTVIDQLQRARRG